MRATGPERHREREDELDDLDRDRPVMEAFALVWAVGAAVLALWIDARVRPEAELASAMRHALAAWLALLLMPHVLGAAVAESASPSRTIAALFAIFLPSLVYTFLAGLWLLRVLAAARLR